MDLLHRKAQSYKFSNKNDLFCAWRDFNKTFCGISTYHKWMFKLQISSIFNFDRAHQSWISGLLGVKQYTGYGVSSLTIQNELDFCLKGSVRKSSLISFERVMAHYYYILCVYKHFHSLYVQVPTMKIKKSIQDMFLAKMFQNQILKKKQFVRACHHFILKDTKVSVELLWTNSFIGKFKMYHVSGIKLKNDPNLLYSFFSQVTAHSKGRKIQILVKTQQNPTT